MTKKSYTEVRMQESKAYHGDNKVQKRIVDRYNNLANKIICEAHKLYSK